MAKLVVVNSNSHRDGIDNVGDIVSVHDDKVELSGGGYDNVDIVSAKGLSENEVLQKIEAMQPQQKKIDAGLTIRIEWLNGNGKWRKLIKRPKYKVNIAELSAKDITDLAGTKLEKSQKLDVIGKGTNTIKITPENQVLVNAE